MDPRIGKLLDGSFYCFPNGYDQPEVRGSLATVTAALRPRNESAKTLKTYVVTVTPIVIVYTGLHCGGAYEETVMAPSRDVAISIARKHRFENEGRLAVRASFRARRA